MYCNAMDYSTPILCRRRGCIDVAREWEKENRPEQELCSIAVTSLCGKFLRLIAGQAFPRPYRRGTAEASWAHCLWRDSCSCRAASSSSCRPPPCPSQLGNATEPALPPGQSPPRCGGTRTRTKPRSSASSALPGTAAAPLVTPKVCTRVAQATTWSCTAIFKLNRSRLRGRRLVTRLLSPPLSSCCPVRQSELISHLAPCLPFSEPHPAPSHLEQEQSALSAPSGAWKCPCGAGAGTAADARQEHLHLHSFHLLPTTARVFAEPCSSGEPFAAHACGAEPLLQQQGGTHSAGTQIGKLGLWMCLCRAEHHPSQHPVLGLQRGEEAAASSHQDRWFASTAFLGTGVKDNQGMATTQRWGGVRDPLVGIHFNVLPQSYTWVVKPHSSLERRQKHNLFLQSIDVSKITDQESILFSLPFM